MPITVGKIVSWLIIGLIAGPLAGAVLNRSRRGYGIWGNVLLGLIGALLGGLVFSLLRMDFGLSGVVVTLTDVVRAFLGALIFIGVYSLVRYIMRRRRAGEATDRRPNDRPPI